MLKCLLCRGPLTFLGKWSVYTVSGGSVHGRCLKVWNTAIEAAEDIAVQFDDICMAEHIRELKKCKL